MVPDDLAEEQVHALDPGGALVQAVDLRVPDVLLDRVVLEEPGSAEGLQGQGEHLVGTLGPDALDDGQEQVVQRGRGLVGAALRGRDLDRVLDGGRVEHERAHALGVRLLQHQHAADVGVVHDRDPRRGLVGQLGQVGSLDPAPGEVERVQVPGGQGGDRLGPDQHPGVLDDPEHLPDAVVHAADQHADRRAARAERQLAGGRGLQAHLVLDRGDVHAVPLAERPVLADQVLRDEEHRQPLGAGAVAHGPGQDQVEDVLRQVVLGAGDEPLDALDMPGAVRLLDRPGAARADVGARVGLGQHHGAAPLAVDGLLGEPLLLRRAYLPQDAGHRVPAGVHPDRGVGAEDQLGHGPAERRRSRGPAQLGGQGNAVPLGVHEGAVRLAQRLGNADRAGLRVEDGRIAVRVGEGLGQRADGHPLHLGQDAPGGFLVQVGVRGLAQQVLAAQHLEQVELDVAQVGLVVAHPLLRRFARFLPFRRPRFYATR